MKIKTYVMIVSEFFPKSHNKSGLPTEFINKIGGKIKKHTIRGNYPLWKKRIEDIQKGNAVLSIRYWIGNPYSSKQKEVYVLDKKSGIGVQELKQKVFDFKLKFIVDDKHVVPIENLSENDGLSLDDFKEWFKAYDLSESMAIIHFTDERY